MTGRWEAGEDVALQQMPREEAPVEVAPSKRAATPREWMRQNLFSTPFNGVVTVVVGGVTAWLAFGLVRWVFVTADWQIVKTNLRLYMIGGFPFEEAWRIWASVYLLSLLGGLTYGVTGYRLGWAPRRAVLRTLLVGLVLGALVYLLDGLTIWLLTLGVPVVVASGVIVGRRFRIPVRRALVGGWLLAFPAVVLLLRAFDGVPPRRWGGFVLNLLVAAAAIFLSFPVGILLALGRRSSLPAIRLSSVAVIEFVRGAPLVAWIIFGQFILPLMLPPQLGRPASLVIQIVVFTFFSSAYVAEIVRGGLQSVHSGQYEAARALGLSTTRMMAFVVLPQALRNTIPAMISHFISLFKDTSLLAALSIVELLRAARLASAQLAFIGHQREALLAAGLIFWMVTFSMSRWSQRLERRLGVGER